MMAFHWFGGWIFPVAMTGVIVAGYWHPLLGGEREDVAKAEKKLKRIHDILKKGYVEECDTEKLFDGAARGMLSSLDNHCQYFDPAEMKEFEIDTEGHYGGIGVQVEFTGDGLEVVTAFEGTPAFKAGLVAGDRITDIDGHTTENMRSGEAAKFIRGEPGTIVKLTVTRKSNGKSELLPIARAEIQLPSVKGTAIVDEKTKIGYVRLIQFQEDSFDKLKEAIDGLLEKGMKALVIDLRFDGGGLLIQAEKIADLFLESGVIVETKGRLEESNSHVEAVKEGTYPNFPVAILVNDGTASASEIVSGALQDHKRAVLVGSKTYGKGSVQQYLTQEFDDGSGFKYTIARYFTPNGRWIDRKAGKDYGLEPDIPVDLTPQETLDLMEHWRKQDAGDKDEKYQDKQLDAALNALRAVLALGNGK